MIVIASFSCGCSCHVKVNSVVVAADPAGVDDVIGKLSVHSCYFQDRPAGYDDLVLVDGALLRSELLPESSVDEVTALGIGEFGDLWSHRDRLHREVDQELQSERPMTECKIRGRELQRGQRPEPESKRLSYDERRPVRIVCEPAVALQRVYAFATFTDDGRVETKGSTVVVNIERPDIAELVRRLSLHSCYWQSCSAGYADLVVAEGRLVRCELTPVDRETRLLSLGEFHALWEEQEREIEKDKGDIDKRREMRARAAIRRDTPAVGENAHD